MKTGMGVALIVTMTLGGSLGATMQAPAKKAAAAGRLVVIATDDAMKFSVTAIAAKPGERITVRITNTGKMPKMASAHNFVLLQKGTNVQAFATEAMMAGATEYIPAKLKTQIVANTKLAGPGETFEVTFTAPTATGAYPFICSFPGHYATMKGTLTVQ